MDKTYWLGRKRASLTAARAATCSEARLIHYELAGRYSLNAITIANDLESLAPFGADPQTERRA
ncbi:hypothetical protein GCM10023264_12050 [Sphingomonas daechungensis]